MSQEYYNRNDNIGEAWGQALGAFAVPVIISSIYVGGNPIQTAEAYLWFLGGRAAIGYSAHKLGQDLIAKIPFIPEWAGAKLGEGIVNKLSNFGRKNKNLENISKEESK